MDEEQHQLSEYIDDEGENEADEAEYIPIGLEDEELAGGGAAGGGGQLGGENEEGEGGDTFDVAHLFRHPSQRASRDSDGGAAGGEKHSQQYNYRKGIVDSDSIDGSLLEGDLVEYLRNEKHQRKLRESGYYDIDDFLQFQ